MTARDDAIARVTRLGATASAPVISLVDVGAIVDTYQISDVNGVPPGATGYVATYDTNAAIAEVYDQKAGQVAGAFNFSADDASYDKADLLSHMLAMRDRYAARAVTAAGVSARGAGTLQVGGTNAGLVNPLDVIASQVIP